MDFIFEAEKIDKNSASFSHSLMFAGKNRMFQEARVSKNYRERINREQREFLNTIHSWKEHRTVDVLFKKFILT